LPIFCFDFLGDQWHVSARMLVKNENQRQSYTSNVFILKD